MCNTPWRQYPRCATYRRDHLRSVKPCAEMTFTVCNIPPEINCTPQNQNRNLRLSLVAFKETIRRNSFRGKHIDHERKDQKKILDLLRIFFIVSQRQLCDWISRQNGNRILKYCLSGSQMGLNHGKNWCLNISWYTPFKESPLSVSGLFTLCTIFRRKPGFEPGLLR